MVDNFLENLVWADILPERTAWTRANLAGFQQCIMFTEDLSYIIASAIGCSNKRNQFCTAGTFPKRIGLFPQYLSLLWGVVLGKIFHSTLQTGKETSLHIRHTKGGIRSIKNSATKGWVFVQKHAYYSKIIRKGRFVCWSSWCWTLLRKAVFQHTQ